MIYAIIIIAALAAAFVILVRRLPEAANQVNEQPTSKPSATPAPVAAKSEKVAAEKTEKKGFSFTMPSIQLPQFPKSQPSQPQAAKPEPQPEPTNELAAKELPAPDTEKKPNGFSFPKFSLPSWPAKSAATPPTSPATPTTSSDNTTDTKDSFWGELDQPTVTTPTPKPAAPVTPPTPAPVAKPAPVMAPMINAAKERLKPKDLIQEAEDMFAIRDYRKAEKLYVRLAATDPKNPKIYSRLGVIYMEQNSFEDARDALQQAIKLEPNVASRHYNLALAYANLGSQAKAIASMEAALKYEPSNRKYRKTLDELLSSR